MGGHNTRRDFLKTTALAGAGFWAAGGVSLAEDKSANSEISFACIGVGGKGASDSGDAARHGNVVAICDIDEGTLGTAGSERFPKARKFTDFRKMLDDFGASIDAVTVSTPDHTHAPAAVMAMKMGKHCFCQKPLTHSVYEARRMGEIAREMKLATQMGNQGTAERALREAAALVQAGAIGPVSEVHVWTNRPIWAQGGPRPEESPVPSIVNWDLWLGPAPYRPFAAKSYHPFAWRGWWDFGTGALGDMACHTMNLPYMALQLSDPESIEAETSGHNQDSYPKSSKITYQFPATSRRPAVTLVWYDGGNRPSRELLDGIDPPGSGSLMIGTKAKLYSASDYGHKYEILSKEPLEKPKVEYTASPGHFTEFAQAIKGGPAAVSNFADYSSGLTETVLLGNLAVWSGKRIEWDAKQLKAKNAPEVASIIKREYREGYSL